MGADAVATVGVLAEPPHLRGEARCTVERDLLRPGHQLQRAQEAGRIPPRREQLLGLVPSPLPPISLGGRVSRSRRLSDDFTWPSRPPPLAVDSAV